MDLKRFGVLVIYALLIVIIPILLFYFWNITRIYMLSRNQAYCEEFNSTDCPEDRCRIHCTPGIFESSGCAPVCIAK